MLFDNNIIYSMETTRSIANLFEGIYRLGKIENMSMFYNDVYVEKDSRHYPIESYLEMLRNEVCVSVNNKCKKCPLYEEICYGRFLEYVGRLRTNKKPSDFPLTQFISFVRDLDAVPASKQIKHIIVGADSFRNRTLPFVDPFLYKAGKKSFAGMTPEEVRREAEKIKNK